MGYEVGNLSKQIKKILKLDVVHKAALVGVGNVGSAVLTHPGFEKYNFDIAAAFGGNRAARCPASVSVKDSVNVGFISKSSLPVTWRFLRHCNHLILIKRFAKSQEMLEITHTPSVIRGEFWTE